MSRPLLRTGAAALLLGLLPLLPGVPAGAEEPADTTPPAITFSPCDDGSPSTSEGCQRYRARDYGTVGSAEEDLAVVGVRLGDTVLDEYVYNDGTGPDPYGSYAVGDTVVATDWVLDFVVPAGTNDVTYYARDLSGNATVQTVQLQGATVPSRPRPRAFATGPRRITVSNLLSSDFNGGDPVKAEVRHVGRKPRIVRFSIPSCECTTSYRGMRPGGHRFRVRTANQVGWSDWSVVRVVIRRHSVA